MVIAPEELVWDYSQPLCDLLWRLQRIADFSPLMDRTEKL